MSQRFARKLFKLLTGAFGLGVLLALASCVPPAPRPPVQAPAQNPYAYQNPYPVGTYEHFIHQPDYTKTYRVYKNYEVLNRTTPENSRIVIALWSQRARLMNGNEVAMDYPVSTGTYNFPTPAGEYKIREMVEDKRSNQYGKILDADGNVVKSSTSMPQDKGLIPEGGKFEGAHMPYWMRLTWAGIGMHVGKVPRYPASHACIRGQASVMPIVYSKVKLLTPVTIEE